MINSLLGPKIKGSHPRRPWPCRRSSASRERRSPRRSLRGAGSLLLSSATKSETLLSSPGSDEQRQPDRPRWSRCRSPRGLREQPPSRSTPRRRFCTPIGEHLLPTTVTLAHPEDDDGQATNRPRDAPAFRFEPTEHEPTSGSQFDRVCPAGRQPRSCPATQRSQGYELTAHSRTTGIGQTQQRDSRTPAWLLSAAGGNTEPA